MARKHNDFPVTPELMKQLAIHEAGHVAAHLALGGKMRKSGAWIKRNGDGKANVRLGRYSKESLERSIVVSLAGGIAVRRVQGKELTTWGACSAGDALEAVDALVALFFREVITGELSLEDNRFLFTAHSHLLEEEVISFRSWPEPPGIMPFLLLCRSICWRKLDDFIWEIILRGYPTVIKQSVWVRRLLQLADDAERVLDQNWEKVERIADILLEMMKVGGEELEEIFNEAVSHSSLTAA